MRLVALRLGGGGGTGEWKILGRHSGAMNANGRGGLGAFWRRLTLWPRLAIGVTLGFVALFAGFSVLGIRAVDTSTTRILHERLALTQELAEDFDVMLEHAFAEIAAFDPAGSSPAVRHRLLLQLYRGGEGVFATVYLLDRRGRVLDSLGPKAPARGASLGDEPYVTRVLSTGRRAISTGFRDGRGRPVVALAVPVAGPDRGVLVATIDLAGQAIIERLDTATRLERTGHAELVGPDGIALASTEPGEALHPGEHLAFYRKMLRSSTSGIADVAVTPKHPEPPALQHERHVMAFARLSVAPWGVALGGTNSETYAPAQRLRRTLLLAGGGSLAALWLLTLLGARLLVHPVRALTGAAEEMASGNLDRPVEVTEGGEIGVLGESLETMRVQLRDSLETVRRWGEELELKVAERTGELNARNRQLRAVSAILAAANEARDLEDMLERCLDVVLEQTGTDAAAVRLIDSERPASALSVARGGWREFPCRSCGERFCADATADGQALFLSPEQRARVHPGCAISAEALTVLPLRGPSGILGVLTLGRRRGALPAPDERPVLNAISDQIAVAVENARLATELRRLEARHEVQRMRSELISAVSHELRTPLGFIKSYATTLLRDDTPIDAATRRQFLETIDEETDKLDHMIDELLDASRIQAGRLPVDRHPIRLGALLARATDKARPSLHANRHEIVLHLPEDDPLVLADDLRIEQVLDNLLENASRYSDPDSPVRIALSVDDNDTIVEVANRGNGLTAAELEQIFEPFHRGRNSKDLRVRGAGLGLAISRGIIDAHQGRIWAETAAHTTTFLFTLPLAPATT